MDELQNREGLADRINGLYWESDATVGSIGEELGISKNALYAAVRPIASGSRCAECGEPTLFTNRTNRASGTTLCPHCEDSMDLYHERHRSSESSEDPGTEADPRGWARWREDLSEVPPQRVAMIGGAAILGVVLGAVAVLAARELG